MNLINTLITGSSQWSNSGYQSDYSRYPSDATFSAVLASFAIIIIIALVLAVLVLIANYKIMQKMGHDGYKGLIPMVNVYLMMEKIGVSAKWLVLLTFGSIICAIPLIGFVVWAVVIVYFSILFSMSLAKAFGKSTGFGVGLLLLNPIFMCILGFGNSEFVGADPMHDAIFGTKEPSSPLATPIGSSENKENNTVETMEAEKPAEEPVITTEEPVMTTEQPTEPVVNSEPTMEPVADDNKEDTL